MKSITKTAYLTIEAEKSDSGETSFVVRVNGKLVAKTRTRFLAQRYALTVELALDALGLDFETSDS